MTKLARSFLVTSSAAGGVMGPDYDQEKWIEFYKSAVFELEQSLVAGRIADAREEIVKRLEALRNIPGLHTSEQQAIEDALNNLRVLEREDADITEQHEKTKAALERLRSIEPKIKGPNG